MLAFYNVEPQLGPYPVSSLALSYGSHLDDADIEYTLTHLFPEPRPYFVALSLTMMAVCLTGDWEPTVGDLMTAPLEPDTHSPVYVGSGEHQPIDAVSGVLTADDGAAPSFVVCCDQQGFEGVVVVWIGQGIRRQIKYVVDLIVAVENNDVSVEGSQVSQTASSTVSWSRRRSHRW